MNSRILGMIGVWLFSDALYSLFIYIQRQDQKWWADHSIRVVRGLIGLALMFWG